MDLTGKVDNITIDYKTNKPIISFVINEKGACLNAYDQLKDLEKLSIRVVKYREKRSLDANACFHALINELAGHFNMSEDEMKIRMNLQYGTIDRDKTNKIMGAKVPKGTEMKSFYPYSKWYKEEDGFDCYLFYKRTRNLNTLEFSRLLDGVIQECKEVGIPTPDDIEFKRLIDEYDASNSKKTRF